MQGGPWQRWTHLCVSVIPICVSVIPGTWESVVVCYRHRKWHGHLARRQNIELHTMCLLYDGVLACALLRPVVWTQVMAEQHGNSLTLFPLIQNGGVSNIGWLEILLTLTVFCLEK